VKYFYIFVRQDVPLEQQIIQTNHATQQMMEKFPVAKDFIPYTVLIGLPNAVWMDSVIRHLKNLNIDHVAFLDTDFDFGVAATVTVPLEDDQRQALRHYPLYRSS